MPTQSSKVFTTLMENAIRYWGEDVRNIRISYNELDDTLIITCEDDGVVFPQKIGSDL